MKKFLQIAFVLALMLLSCIVRAQQEELHRGQDLKGFNTEIVKEHFLLHHPDGTGWEEFLAARLRDFHHPENSPLSKASAPNPIINTGCTNVDFEDGTLNGWTSTTGFNPNYNITGCCVSAGGAQTIMSGAGTDPCGGFPVVAPGGSFSLRLGNNGVNGIADRVEQTFQVSANNTFFQYRYAVVLEDPGHTLADQPSFQIEMLDQNGNPITCAQYQVSAGQGIPGFQNSTTCPGVIYKPWTTVALDLSGYLNQNVTIRFTTYDCALGGHFGYAYIDGSCLQFNLVSNVNICNNANQTLLGIPGAATWLWFGNGVGGQTTQNVNINAPGNYSVQSTSITGCPLPSLFFNVSTSPAPTASFTNGGNILCNTTVNFTNTSTYNGSSSGSSFWSFGDGTTSNMDNPVHTYPNPGTYQVQLIVYSTNGCSDTANASIQILTPMVTAFSFTAACAGSTTLFQDNSFVIGGNTNQWNWNFGDGTSSTLQNPSHIYAVAGTYQVILSANSSSGCSDSDTMQVTIHPIPQLSFSASPVCFGNLSSLINSSSISSGSITSYAWDFNTDGITDNTSVNPNWQFANAGNINVNLSAVSNNGCTANYTGQVTVFPQPLAAFTSTNVCEGIANSFTNTSTIQNPGSIAMVNWNFGDNTSSSLSNPNHLYATDGTYNVSLSATSADGCVGNYSAQITVFPAPVAAFTAPPVCLNFATVFTNASSVSGGVITSYAWDFDNNGSVDNNGINPNFTYGNDGNYLVSLTVSTNNNCISTITNTATVYPLPLTNFTGNQSCLGNSTTFTDLSSVSSGSIVSRKWDFEGDGFIDFTGMNPTHVYPASGTQNPVLLTITNNNCTSSNQKIVYVNPNPVVNFSVDDPDGCPEHCVNFNNLSTIASGNIASYTWNFGDNTANSSSVNPAHCYNSGAYTISLTAISDSGCISTVAQNNMINVFPEPTAGFSVNPEEPDVLQPLVFINDESAGASTWNYFLSDGIHFSSQSFQHLFATEEPQSFTVTQVVSNTFGCVDTAVKTIEVKGAYSLYVPNAFTPNEDGKNDIFLAQGIGITEFNFWIYDRWGNMIFFSNDLNQGWDGKVMGGHSDEVAQMDVFVWKARVKDINNKSHSLMGKVTIVK